MPADDEQPATRSRIAGCGLFDGGASFTSVTSASVVRIIAAMLAAFASARDLRRIDDASLNHIDTLSAPHVIADIRILLCLLLSANLVDNHRAVLSGIAFRWLHDDAGRLLGGGIGLVPLLLMAGNIKMSPACQQAPNEDEACHNLHAEDAATPMKR